MPDLKTKETKEMATALGTEFTVDVKKVLAATATKVFELNEKLNKASRNSHLLLLKAMRIVETSRRNLLHCWKLDSTMIKHLLCVLSQRFSKMTHPGDVFAVDCLRSILPSEGIVAEMNEDYKDAISVEVRPEEAILVTIKDMTAVRALTSTSTAVGHAVGSTWTTLQADLVSLKFIKKAIPGSSQDPEQKYGTLVRVTSVGIDIMTVRKLTGLLISRL
ncbi:uncharacterized protein LOC142575562 [Dermacentor variabilis]|uniref:uncharacterized protein LOC142575562 n=1 Tax=Dermacentor variabilis TaxID=34621 RepID=UPI003F5C2141